MKVVSLHIYPLKSGAGVDLVEARAEERGFRHDRRLMAVDDEGTFLSQRKHPRLGYIHVDYADGGLVLSAHDASPLEVPDIGDLVDVTVWGDAVRARDRGPAAAEWLSDYLQTSARLVDMPSSSVRPVEGGDVPVSFADGYPYLLTTTRSLADLNGRIDGPPVPMRAFRPNIVVDGDVAWAEDGWRRIRIGDAEFDVAKPCTRCKIPTLDPDEPERARRDGEPLRTLAKFRRRPDGNGVLFGQNLICRTPGTTIRVGDSVALLEP